MFCTSLEKYVRTVSRSTRKRKSRNEILELNTDLREFLSGWFVRRVAESVEEKELSTEIREFGTFQRKLDKFLRAENSQGI